MNAEQFSSALGKVNDKYIIEAVTYKQSQKKKSIWLKRGTMAACFALILAGTVITLPRILGGSNHVVLPPNPDSPGPVSDDGMQVSDNSPISSDSDGMQVSDNPSIDLNWQTAEEIYAAENQDGSQIMAGVFIPTFVAYQGAFYGAADETSMSQTRFCAVTEKVSFNSAYEHTVYLVENYPDCIALLINGYFTIYQKQFDVTFELDGITYGIVYNAAHPDSRILGEILLSNDSFTVYEAVFYPGEPREQAAYVVDILPKLRAAGYSFFLEDGVDYADAWWVAEPIIAD